MTHDNAEHSMSCSLAGTELRYTYEVRGVTCLGRYQERVVRAGKYTAHNMDGLCCLFGMNPTLTPVPQEHRIPFDVISEKSEVTRPGESGTLIVSRDYAQERGWIHEILAGG